MTAPLDLPSSIAPATAKAATAELKLRQEAGGPESVKKRTFARWEAMAGYAFIAPWLVGFFVFTLGPMLYSLYLSFTKYDPRGAAAPHWIGLDNYIFALTNVGQRPLAVNLKCDPERAHGLREAYPAVQPGWHMNKRHWNTVTVDGSLPEGLFEAMVDHSYELVVKGLRRDDREKLERLGRMKAGLSDPAS